MKRLLVSGSSGLVGSEVARKFSAGGWLVHGIDNNMRMDFFGASGDTRENLAWLQNELPYFAHHEVDVRDRVKVLQLVKGLEPDAIVHCAAQPSHDLSAQRPFDDFDVNAVGTLNLLEAGRQYCKEAPFVHLSTNKVYGDRLNDIALVEKATRWEFADQAFANGIAETFSIDQSKHSLFGASKVAADVMVQEYGRYFGMPTCVLRGGCLTGPRQSGVELHGFLNHLVRMNVSDQTYTIFGYKGKQVRDNIHCADVATFIAAFIARPRVAEVYNIGGGRQNSVSVLEALQMVGEVSGKEMRYEYCEQNRVGDHICYYSDLTKVKSHYPDWEITKTVPDIVAEIHAALVV